MNLCKCHKLSNHLNATYVGIQVHCFYVSEFRVVLYNIASKLPSLTVDGDNLQLQP